MIKEEFVQFETAKLLKDAGFPQDYKEYMIWYNSDGERRFSPSQYLQFPVSAPTQAVAMRWLRDVHQIWVDISYGSGEMPWATGVQNYLVTALWQIENHKGFITRLHPADSYEAAAEAGIQAACEYLIEKGK